MIATHLKDDPHRRTPEHILNLAREVMGEIDLDPASDVNAQKVVRAIQWFDVSGIHEGPVSMSWFEYIDRPGSALRVDWNGRVWLNPPGGSALRVDWHGRVWLNPPGGVLDPKTLEPRAKGPGLSSAAVWWSKLVHEFKAGRVTEALFLGFTLEIMRTSQRWGDPVQAFSFCVPSERLRFPSSNGGEVSSPPMGSVVVYLGPNAEKFRHVFAPVGWCT